MNSIDALMAVIDGRFPGSTLKRRYPIEPVDLSGKRARRILRHYAGWRTTLARAAAHAIDDLRGLNRH